MPETSKTATVRSMVMTIFGERLPEWEAIKEKIKYFAYADEVCPSTGRPHKQAFAYAWKPMRLAGWRKLFPEIHMETMRGAFRDNEAYCSKQGKLTEHGVRPEENGIKTSVLEFKRRIDAGERVEEIADCQENFNTYLLYKNGLKEFAAYKRRKTLQMNRDVPAVYLRIGTGGTGKTRWLDDTFGLDGWRYAPDNTGKWFDNCDERDVIVFDDVEAGQIPPISLWKRLTDRYPLPVPVKGGYITWKPKAIVVTSNYEPGTWWPGIDPINVHAVMRRVYKIVRVFKDGKEEEVFNPFQDATVQET